MLPTPMKPMVCFAVMSRFLDGFLGRAPRRQTKRMVGYVGATLDGPQRIGERMRVRPPPLSAARVMNLAVRSASLKGSAAAAARHAWWVGARRRQPAAAALPSTCMAGSSMKRTQAPTPRWRIATQSLVRPDRAAARAITTACWAHTWESLPEVTPGRSVRWRKERVAAQFDARDPAPAACGSVACRGRAGVDHQVQHHAAGVGLEGVALDLPVAAEVVGGQTDVALAEHARKPRAPSSASGGPSSPRASGRATSGRRAGARPGALGHGARASPPVRQPAPRRCRSPMPSVAHRGQHAPGGPARGAEDATRWR